MATLHFNNRHNGSEDAPLNLPPLQRDARGNVDLDSVPDVIQWFLDYDQRVAIIKHPNVEEVFQWKQEQSRRRRAKKFSISIRPKIGWRSESFRRLPRTPPNARFIRGLANFLTRSTPRRRPTKQLPKLTSSISRSGGSIVKEAEKIPSAARTSRFLINCWVETLCTAEARVLGWLYKEFYGRPLRLVADRLVGHADCTQRLLHAYNE